MWFIDDEDQEIACSREKNKRKKRTWLSSERDPDEQGMQARADCASLHLSYLHPSNSSPFENYIIKFLARSFRWERANTIFLRAVSSSRVPVLKQFL